MHYVGRRWLYVFQLLVLFHEAFQPIKERPKKSHTSHKQSQVIKSFEANLLFLFHHSHMQVQLQRVEYNSTAFFSLSSAALIVNNVGKGCLDLS